jgi:2,3-bisphosphoglycerate-independent phosphoglycerate mutase
MAKLVLLLLDGFGAAPRTQSNPRSRAATPTIDRLEAEAFATTLQASGIAVGLPWGEPGNSEVGHLSIGSGRIVYHHLPRIIASIQDGSFFTNPALTGAFAHAKKHGGRVHVMGLVSSGSVHAYVDHLYALMEMAQQQEQQIALHIFSDGRDAEPKEAQKFLPQIAERMQSLAVGRIVSIVGRDYAMDRDGHWDRTEKAYHLIAQGIGERAVNVEEAIAAAYAKGLSDSGIPPTAILGPDAVPVTLSDGDALIFLNFREDSARQISEAFSAKEFTRFARPAVPNLKFVTLTQYAEGMAADVAFPPVLLTNTLGEVFAQAGLSQLRVAETDKYAHVTYFFNGLREQPFEKEERSLIPSVSVQSEDQAPAMRAADIAETIARDVEKPDGHDIIIANFANADMVGHTGNFEACAKALEALDAALERVVSVCAAKGVPLFITADHGNVEEKLDLMTGRSLTEHTTNPVPFFAMGPGVPLRTEPFDPTPDKARGLIIDVAPTALTLLGIPVPADMAGRNLFATPENPEEPTVTIG